MVYALCIFILLVLIYIYDYKSFKSGRDSWYYFILIYLILVAGLRYRVGMDTIGYMNSYDINPDLHSLNLSIFSENSKYQPLWIIYVAILKTISPSFVLLQFSNAIIVNTIIFSFIKRNSRYLFTSLFIYTTVYYLEFNFEIMRESLALSIFLIAIYYLQRSKWIPYFIICSICFGFHFSGLFTFIIPLFKKVKINKFTISILFIISMLVYEVAQFTETILLYLPFQNAKFYTNEYTDNKFTVSLNIRGYIAYLIINFLIPISMLLYYKYIYKKQYIFSSFIYSMIIVGLLIVAIPIFSRFKNYLYIFYVILLSDVIIRTIKPFKIVIPLPKQSGYPATISMRQKLKEISPRRVKFKFATIILIISLIYIPLFGLYNLRLDLSGYNKNDKNYSRYFPYSSILDPQKSRIRESYVNQTR